MQKVSIIIPAYNAEKTIIECLDSVLAQTYRNFEAIVVDDGSRDCTRRKVEEKATQDSRIKLLTQKNAGVSAARNHGLQAASGELISFLDSDDALSPDFLKALVPLCTSQTLPVAGIIRSDGKTGVQPVDEQQMLKIPENLAREYLCGEFGQKIAFSASNKLFQNDIIRKENLKFEETLPIGEDLVFVLRYLQYCAKVVICGKAQYFYNINEGSAMHTKGDYTEAYEKLVKHLRTLVSDDALQKWALQQTTFILKNGYIEEKSYSDFKKWWHDFSETELCRLAEEGKQSCSLKFRILRQLMRTNQWGLLYLCLKL